MYVGELCRLLIIDAIDKRLLFGGVVPEKLAQTNSFHGQYMFDIDR